MQIQFLGATGTVTGSKYLVSAGAKKILIDCGLFQGFKQLRLRNWAQLPVDPRAIDAVILTHAHIDHSGYLPLLVKNGFRGKLFAAVPPAISARSCCPTPVTCRRRRDTRIKKVFPSITRRCRCIRAATPSRPCGSSSLSTSGTVSIWAAESRLSCRRRDIFWVQLLFRSERTTA